MKKYKKSDSQISRDVHRHTPADRFPESKMSKNSRKDAEKAHQEFGTDSLSDNVNNSNSKKVTIKKSPSSFT